MKQEDINCYVDQLIYESMNSVLLGEKTEKLERMLDRVEPAIMEEYLDGPILDNMKRLWKRK
jgi:hypothetical protein